MSRLSEINPGRYVKHFMDARKSRVSCRSHGVFFLNMAVTYRCNAKCGMCGIWKIYEKNPLKAGEELSLEDYKKFFVLNREYLKELFHVGVTGGEPFLRSDLRDIILLINSSYPKAHVDISTNGMLPEAIKEGIEWIYEKTPKLRLQLDVSLDGLGRDHDRMRGVKGVFKRVEETCSILADIMRERRGFGTTISFTITPENYDRLYDVYLFSRERNFSFACRPAHISDLYYNNTSMDYSFTREMIDDIGEQISRIPYSYRSFFMQHIPDFLRNPDKKRVPCYSGFHSMYIDPYGDAFPCLFIKRGIGNIRDKQFFKENWNSRSTIGVRESIKAGRCPNCWTECEVNKSAYLDGKNFVVWYITHRFK